MAKKSSAKSRSTKKQAKVPGLFGRRFGKPAMFAAFFALVGVATLFAGFAATPTGKIVNSQSGECLENFFNRQLNTNFISTYPCRSGNQAQDWVLASDSSIRTKQNYCLEFPNASRSAGTRVFLWQCNGSAGQKWEVQSNGTIKNPRTGLCLEATAADTFLGGPNLLTQACNSNNKRQVWSVPTDSIPVPVPIPPPVNPPANTTPSGAVSVKSSCSNTNSNVANGTTVRNNYPNDANTGPEVAGFNEDKLPVPKSDGGWSVSGSKITINKDGAVLENVYHNGIIVVNANNVKIRNSVICGTGTFVVENNGSNLVIENSILRGERGTSMPRTEAGEPCAAGVGRSNYTLLRSEVSGCADGLKTGGTIDIRNNWFHDNFTNRGIGGVPGGGTHNDTVQQVNSSSSSFVFEGNAAYQDACTSNRHFQMAPTGGTYSASNLRIQNNFFYGIKGFNFDRSFTAPGGRINGNVFAGTAARGPFSPPLYSGNGMGSISVGGNRYESGESADSNFLFSYQCVNG